MNAMILHLRFKYGTVLLVEEDDGFVLMRCVVLLEEENAHLNEMYERNEEEETEITSLPSRYGRSHAGRKRAGVIRGPL